MTKDHRVYSRKSRATRFKKIHIIHHPGLISPILFVLVSSQTTLKPEEIHEAVKEKKHWYSWFTE